MNFSSSQIGLLNLCKNESGPSITEIFEFGPSYGLKYNTIFNDYIFLLSNKMIWPVGFIEKETFLPTHCLLTEKGEKAISEILSDNPNLVPDISIGWNLHDKDSANKIIQEHIPNFDCMKNDIIQDLADSYSYWATLGNDGKLRIPDDQLYYAAARGYFKINEYSRFRNALKGWYDELEKKGNFLDLIILSQNAIKEFPNQDSLIINTATEILRKPFWELTGKNIQEIQSISQYQDFIREYVSISIDVGKKYSFDFPNQNSLIGIANRIEDFLGESFNVSNKNLFYQTIQLFYHYIELFDSLVSIKTEELIFEKNAGFKSRIEIAKKCCVVLEGRIEMIMLKEPFKKKAFDLALKSIRLLRRSFASPICNIRINEDDMDNIAGHWIFGLMKYPEHKIKYELVAIFREIDSLLKTNKLKIDSNKEVDFNLSREIAFISQTISSIKEDTNSIAYIIPEMNNSLVDLLNISLSNNNQIVEICKILLSSNSLLMNIDRSFNSSLDEIKQDLIIWQGRISESQVISQSEKVTFLKEMGEIMKLNSSAKIFASIPLIPGFLKYQYEVNLNTDWNKWFVKLKECFKSDYVN